MGHLSQTENQQAGWPSRSSFPSVLNSWQARWQLKMICSLRTLSLTCNLSQKNRDVRSRLVQCWAIVCDFGSTLEPTLVGRLAFTYTGMPMSFEAWQTHAHAVAIQVMVQTINFYCNTSHIIIISRAIQFKFLSCDCLPLSLTTEWASRTPMREWTWNNSGLLTQPSSITVVVSTVCLTIACIRQGAGAVTLSRSVR